MDEDSRRGISNCEKDMRRLNLGCDIHKLEGFINIDANPKVNPDLVADVMDLPFEANSIDEIYAGHIIEHLQIDHCLEALGHWHKLLKPDGVITISFPDFVLTFTHCHFLQANRILMTGCNPIRIGELDRHFSLWNAYELVEHLKRIGYKKVDIIKDSPYLSGRANWQSIVQATK